MTSGEEVRVLPDRDHAPYQRSPETLIGVFSEPNASGAYVLNQVPQLDRIVRSFVPLGNSRWRENPLPNHAEKRAILDTLRTQMQIPGEDRPSSHGRILATTLYWNAVKSLRLSPSEARDEAQALRALIAARKSLPGLVSQEIARNADLALGVLIEAHPSVK